MYVFNIFINQFRYTMELVGVTFSVVCVMRYLGFNHQFVLPTEYIPIWIIGLYVGLVIKDYYKLDMHR